MMINTPKGIELFRLMSLRSGLELEIKGFKRRGKSCYSIIKNEFGLKGNKINVYNQFTDHINELRGIKVLSNFKENI